MQLLDSKKHDMAFKSHIMSFKDTFVFQKAQFAFSKSIIRLANRMPGIQDDTIVL